MRKILLRSIAISIGALSLTNVVGQSYSPVLEKLVGNSDIIIQGIILRKELSTHTFGTAQFKYIIQVDSILKGDPKMYQDVKGEYIRPGQSMTYEEVETSIYVIYFLRHCVYSTGVLNPPKDYIEENCYEEGDSIIVFLKNNPLIMERGILEKEIRYCNDLVDEWLGIFQASSRLASEVKTIVRSQQ